jgi:hypothetical protein
MLITFPVVNVHVALVPTPAFDGVDGIAIVGIDV